jgi:Flp pilus assembly protein TadG
MALLKTSSLSERGAALVEFAIVLPLLLMLVFGIIEFGRAYNNQVTLTHAAREGVREYTISGDADAAEEVAIAAASSGVRTELLTFEFTPCTAGDAASMRVNYPFQFFIPFLPSSPFTLSGTGVMRCGA